MNKATLDYIRSLAGFLDEHQHRLVIDADAHATDISSLTGKLRERYQSGPDYYLGRPISAEDILAEMQMAAVDMALIGPNPSAIICTGDTDRDYAVLLAANRYVFESSRIYPNKFIPAGLVDPRLCGTELALKLVEELILNYGFLFIRLNPNENLYPIDSQPVRQVVDRIIELGGIPEVHFGADTPFTPADGLGRLAACHPHHPIIAVHMGGGGASAHEAEELYPQARAIGLKHPNIRFVLSDKSDAHIENDLITYELAGEPFNRNLFCGSGAPYGRMSWNFGGYRWIFKSLMDHRNHTDPRIKSKPGLFIWDTTLNYLGRNMARLAAAGYKNMLKRAQG